MKTIFLYSLLRCQMFCCSIKKISKLKITTADSGPSIITAAKNLIKAGAKENKKKKSLNDMNDSLFIETDATAMLHDESES